MAQEKKLSDFDFTLEDTKGNSYSSYATKDHVYGRINLEQTIIGGIAFAVSDGSTPRKLVFDTGLVNSFTSEKLYYFKNFSHCSSLGGGGEGIHLNIFAGFDFIFPGFGGLAGGSCSCRDIVIIVLGGGGGGGRFFLV